jgi:signal transduction histidine kinase
MTLEDATAAYRNGRFLPAPSPTIDFGFTDARIWLRLNLKNGDAAPRRSVVALGAAFMHKIDAWLVRANATEHLLSQTEETPFGTRPTDDLHLALPVFLEPGEEAVLYISYWSAAATALPISLETQETFARRTAAQGALHAAFYAVLGAMVVLSLVLTAATRSALFLLYAVYVSIALLFVMHGDGATFRYIWPDWPQWNVFASLPLGLGLNIAAGFFTRAFLNTPKLYPKFDVAFLTVIAVSTVAILAGLAGFERQAKILAFPLVLFGSLVFLAGGVRALRDRPPGILYYVIGWSSISAAALVAFILNSPLVPGGTYVTFDLVRGSMVFDALMMAIALVVRFNLIRQERDELVKRELSAMRANMALVERINALEARHALAAANGMALTSAYHDMRQPLLALRLAVQRVSRHPEAEPDVAQLEGSVAYLEKLADSLLQESQTQATGSNSPIEGAQEASGAEAFDAHIVLDALGQMFRQEAAMKGLALRIVSSSVRLRAPPTVVIRILSNFVSNAVRCTARGGVLVGCRRQDRQIWLCVVDTGSGLDEDELKRVLLPGERGAQEGEGATGYGLGLAIAKRLAHENDFDFRATSRPGKGSCFAIRVGVAGALS